MSHEHDIEIFLGAINTNDRNLDIIVLCLLAIYLRWKVSKLHLN